MRSICSPTHMPCFQHVMHGSFIIYSSSTDIIIMPSCAWVKPSAIPLEFASEILSAIAAMLCCKVSAFVINLKLGAIKAGDFCFFV